MLKDYRPSLLNSDFPIPIPRTWGDFSPFLLSFSISLGKEGRRAPSPIWQVSYSAEQFAPIRHGLSLSGESERKRMMELFCCLKVPLVPPVERRNARRGIFDGK